MRKRTVILASASKRRHSILSSCGIRHKVAVSNVKEHSCEKKGIIASVVINATAKAKKIAAGYKNAVIIGADTLVLLNKKIVGKPRTANQARRLLASLIGKKVSVYTGLCVIDTISGKISSGYEKSYVYVKKITLSDIARYLKVLGPHDKAGGFSIEGAGSLLFDNITGSYFNILGLPMERLSCLFRKVGLDILDFIDGGSF